MYGKPERIGKEAVVDFLRWRSINLSQAHT
jgi:hypothetical protein